MWHHYRNFSEMKYTPHCMSNGQKGVRPAQKGIVFDYFVHDNAYFSIISLKFGGTGGGGMKQDKIRGKCPHAAPPLT